MQGTRKERGAFVFSIAKKGNDIIMWRKIGEERFQTDKMARDGTGGDVCSMGRGK